jgi:hypothetical protein
VGALTADLRRHFGRGVAVEEECRGVAVEEE